MGWPEEPTDWGSPGHVDRGDEKEQIRNQISRLSAAIGYNRWTSGANLAAGIAGTESLANMDTGEVFLESGRLYIVKVRVEATFTATDTYLYRIRKDTVAGTQLDEFTFTCANASFGWRPYWECDYIPSADEETTILLTCQRMSGAGNTTVKAGTSTKPTFMKIEYGGHSTDATTTS
jgi:hypothetical protein